MESKSCKICKSNLEVEQKCKFCEEPTRLFCHTCGVATEKIEHPACMIIDAGNLLLQAHTKN